MIKHKVNISVTKEEGVQDIPRCEQYFLTSKFLRKLFGTQKVVVLVPGASVEEVTVKEIEGKGGTENEQIKAAAGCGS